MKFLDSPSFIYFILVFVVIITNIFPYLVFWGKSKLWKTLATLFFSTMFIIYYIGVLWFTTNEFFIVSVIAFTFSYIHFCFTLKKSANHKLYTIIFTILSLFFSLWTTVLFGKYYVDNNLIDFSNYISRYNSILNADDCFLITDFKLSILFFDISFEKYFTLSNYVSLKNPFFIQFVYGIIISGTAISWVIDTLKHLITPSKPN